jgi:hypothetical protein
LTLDAVLLEEEAKMLKTLAYATVFGSALVGPGSDADSRPLILGVRKL